MNKVRVLILALLTLFVAACSTTPASTTPAAPKGPDLTGHWVLTTESPMGAQDSQMTVIQTGDTLAGQLVSQQGTVDYTGKLSGNDVNFGFAVSVQGTDLKIDYVGTVAGDTMQGKAVFGQFGEGNFTAKRTTP
jgi:hypothetical protein